jgi:hypothetical protein
VKVRSGTEALQWFGLLAAPIAWTVQLVLGYGTTVAACSVAGDRWGVSVATWEIALTAAAAAVAVAGQAAALVAWSRTRDGGEAATPPAGRIHFFADASLLSNTIFLAVILLGGIAAAHLVPCRQS